MTGQLQKKLQGLHNIWFAGELERNYIKEDKHAQISHRLHPRLILTLTYCYGQILSFLTFYSSKNTLHAILSAWNLMTIPEVTKMCKKRKGY